MELADAFQRLLEINLADSGDLQLWDEYHRGIVADPYLPYKADDELSRLAERSRTNLMDLVVTGPVQGMRVDGFSSGNGEDRQDTSTDDWDFWQRSRLDAKQAAIYRGALVYGQVPVLTERTALGVTCRSLSPKRTAMMFDDAANDLNPSWAMQLVHSGSAESGARYRLWDSTYAYDLEWKSKDDYRVLSKMPHGCSTTPITRFAFRVDLEGRVSGVVGPRIALQDRVNQAVFNLLVVQINGAFRGTYVAGHEAPTKRDVDGNQILNDDGFPIPLPVDRSPAQILFFPHADTRVGTIEESQLDGHIQVVEMAIKHMLSISQTPPMLGHMSNISADFLAATEKSLARLREEAQVSFGESWERVARLAAELEGDTERAQDFKSEVKWADVESRNLNAVADALGKYATMLDVPKQALWQQIPGISQSTVEQWRDMAKSENASQRLADALLPPDEFGD